MDSGPKDEPVSDDAGRKRRRGFRLPAPAGPSEESGRTKPRMRKLRFAAVLAGISALAFVSWVFGIMMAVAQDLPALESRQQYDRSQNSIVYDVNGEEVTTLTNNQGRVLLESAEIAPVIKEAVVAVEDRRFYEHRGVDFRGIGRALFQDLLAGSAQQGASTITQQFVKNALAAQQNRTILQKFRESAMAYHLERQWSKDKILTEYLNEIYFGEGATGIEAAARTYFSDAHPGCGEDEDSEACASVLLPWEAALLAGMISSPSSYSPRTSPELALERRNLVLANMAEQGYLTEEESTEYSDPELHPLPAERAILPPSDDSAAPYFTSWLRQQLVDRYGAGVAFGGGLQITSTLDLALQRQVEGIVANRLGAIEPTAGVVVLDNDTGAVRAMVGGSDYERAPFNLATNGHRQPGSAFKPFTLITALEQGRSIDEVFSSAPKEIPFEARFENDRGKLSTAPEVFDVNNYEDSYLGSASLATATTFSDNSVYAELGLQVGPENVAATAAAMGIETDLSTDIEYSIDGGEFQPYNPAMILGGLETGVTPLELAHAYNTIAAGGERLSGTMASSAGGPLGIVDVYDGEGFQEGDPVPDETGASGINQVVGKQVISEESATTAREVLATVVSSGTGANAATGEPTWGKTGTTDDNGDAWFCGATEEITACVWVGHADTVTPMLTEFGGAPVDGSTFPALIFADLVNAYTALEEQRKAGEDPEPGDEEIPEPEVESVAPTETVDPAAVADEGGSGGGGGGGGATEPAPEAQPAPDQAAPSAEAPAAPASGGGIVPE